MSRPTIFSEDLAATICERLVEGESLRSICRSHGMPGLSTVFRWLAENDRFREQYTLAREAQADTFADELADISDEADVIVRHEGEEVRLALDPTAIARNRLRVDTRKWIASKLKPKKYGDKIEHSGGITLESLVSASMAPPAEGAE